MSGQASNSKKTQRIRDGLILAVLLLSTAHLGLLAEPIELLYFLPISFLFSILFVFFVSSIGLSNNLVDRSTCVVICLGFYVILILWFGFIRTIPDYRELMRFEGKQVELMQGSLDGIYGEIDFAKLYMKAPEVMERIQPGIHHRGNMIMHKFLQGKIESGEGENFTEDLYLLAEVGFTYSSKTYAYKWYENAFNHGKPSALKRYDERLAEHGLTKEKLFPASPD